MEKILTFALTGLLCTFVVAMGCTGIPSKSSTAPAITATPIGIAGNSWTGTWMTTWTGGNPDTKMVLVQSGNSVTGTYEYNDGKIMGTVQNNTLVGTWDESNGGNTGQFEFDMSPDGKNFNGWYVHQGEDLTAEKNNPPYWKGIRVS